MKNDKKSVLGLSFNFDVDKKQTAANIAAAIKESGIKRCVIAELLGVTPTAITHWTKGSKTPYYHHLFALAAILNTNPCSLLAFKGDDMLLAFVKTACDTSNDAA